MVFIYNTARDVDNARELGKKIVKARVAACVNIWPMESIYFSDGKLVEDKEAVLFIKTNEPKMAEIENFLIKHHTYTTPIVAAIDVKRLNRQYKEWMGTVIA